jgi:hypothetical protein
MGARTLTLPTEAMRKLLVLTAMLLVSCGNKEKDYRKAENALDAGREFIGSCLQGDFTRAAFYMVANEANTRSLAETEKIYREKDKDGRQQLRTASINIRGVTELSDSVSLIKYSNSFDKMPQTLRVVKRNGDWLADLNTNNSAN